MTTPEPTAAEERARVVAWLDGQIETLRTILDSLKNSDERWRMRAILDSTRGVRKVVATGQHWEKGE